MLNSSSLLKQRRQQFKKKTRFCNIPTIVLQKSWSEALILVPTSHGQSSYWTSMSSIGFLESDQPEGENLGPKLHPGGGFFGP